MSNYRTTKSYESFLQPEPKVIYLTSSKEDVDVFHSSGYSAMTINIPELTEFISQYQSVVYVLAFNTSNNLCEYANVLDAMNVKFYALLPEEGTSWSETLKSGNLNTAILRGKLALATSAQEVANLYHIDRGVDANNTVFCFEQVTYIIKPEALNCTAHPLLNGTISPKFYLDIGRNEKYFIVELSRKGTQPTFHKLTHNELNISHKFMLWLRQHRGLFDKKPGYTRNINALAEHIQALPRVVTRKAEKVGLDSGSNCYVFPGFLYDENGACHESQEHGVFHKFALLAPGTPTGCQIVLEVDDNAIPEQIIKDFYQVYGIQGIYQLGAYIGSIFANEFGGFPIVESTGNSTHVHLNRMFFMDFEGFPLMQQLTLDKMSKIASCFSKWLVPFVENNAPVKIKEADLKGKYANQARLFFHRSFGEFTTQEMLACSVSMDCKQFVGNKTMQAYRPSQLAKVGHAVLSYRKYFEDAIGGKTQQIQQRLISSGVKEDMAFNHAILAAGAELFIEKLRLDFINTGDLYDYTYLLAQRRTKLLSTPHPLADKFFDTLLNKITIPNFNLMEKSKAELAAFSEGAAIMGDKLLLTMPHILENSLFKQVFSQGYTNRPPQLFNQLQRHPAYIMRDHRLCIARPSLGENTRQIRYWVFDLSKVIYASVASK